MNCPQAMREHMKPAVNRNISSQSSGGNDCLVHTCANAALSGDERDFKVTANLDKNLLGKEWRSRMVVMFETGNYMFDLPGCPSFDLESAKEAVVVDLASSDTGSVEERSSQGGAGQAQSGVKVKFEPGVEDPQDAPRERKMEELESMRKSFVSQSSRRTKKESKVAKKRRASFVEGWHFLRARGKKEKGRDPVCATCKAPVSRENSSRIFRFVRYQTKVQKSNYSKTVTIHCREKCVSGLKQPKELSHLEGVCTKEELLSKEWEDGYLKDNLDLKRVLEMCRERANSEESGKGKKEKRRKERKRDTDH